MPLDGHGKHLLGLPLVRPEELADDPDLRIGATELIVADILDHQPVWTDRGADVAEFAGLPGVQARPFGHTGSEVLRVEPVFVGPAITQELPRLKRLCIS